MKKIVIIIFIILTLVCKIQSQIIPLDSVLVKYYSLAINSKDSNLYKEKFFENYPGNFQLFNSIYGYKYIDSDSIYYSPLYGVSMDHIKLFFNLSSIVDKDIFIKKIINISLGGYYEVDAVSIFQQELQKLFLSDTELFLKVLELYTDIEIKSFWHFFFDNNIFDHPFCIKIYSEVYEKIEMLNFNRILNLMKEQYEYDFNTYITNPK